MEWDFSSSRVLATPSLRNPSELCITQQVPVLTTIPARTNHGCCAACLGASSRQKEGVTLPWVREAPGSLSAGSWAEGSPHPWVTHRCPVELLRGTRGGESEPGRVVWTYRTSVGACMEANLSRQTSSLDILWVTSSGSQCTLNTGGLMSKLCCLGWKSLVHFQRISAGISSLAPGRTALGREGEERGCSAVMEESTCPRQSRVAILEAETAKEENPKRGKLTSGAIWLHNSLPLQYSLFVQQQRLVPPPMSRPPCTRH